MVGDGHGEVLRPSTSRPLPLVVSKVVDPQLKETPQGCCHRSFFRPTHLNVEVRSKCRSLQLVINQTVEPQLIVHGEILRRLWDGPFQVASLRSISYRCDLKRCQ
jgi:hypothetical protein